MERFLLYWDDLDDLLGPAALFLGALGRRLLRWCKLAALVAAGFAAVTLGLSIPPLGLAFITLLFVTALYHRVTTPRLPQATPG